MLSRLCSNSTLGATVSPTIQPGILEPIPVAARYLSLRLRQPEDPRGVLAELAKVELGAALVVGLGPSLVQGLGGQITGLHELPSLAGPGVSAPSTPCDLWLWLRGSDQGELLHRGRRLTALLAPAFRLVESVSAFRYGSGLDLSGYEDGTENPVGQAAHETAFVSGLGAGLDGSSFVAVQRWTHDLDRLESFDRAAQDQMIGRRRRDNEELGEAPATAHVKRTEQESFEPPAFMLRRSMPWSRGPESGLVFVAFGHSLASFETMLRRMLGLTDGIVDALFRFTRPETGAAFWCPPLGKDGRLDLSALEL